MSSRVKLLSLLAAALTLTGAALLGCCLIGVCCPPWPV